MPSETKLEAEEIQTQVWHYSDSPREGGVRVEFRLVYKGPLPSESGNRHDAAKIRMAEAKHRIRSAFHPQIRQFWTTHPVLKMAGHAFNARYTEKSLDFWNFYANQNQRVNLKGDTYRFVPLITEENYHGCAIDVLFLRRDTPGTPLIYQGDLDNRMKVLFDALKMPKENNELIDTPQSLDENPCFCLLKDDKYIDHVSITTDRILAPLQPSETINEVLVVVHVNARIENIGLDFSPIR